MAGDGNGNGVSAWLGWFVRKSFEHAEEFEVNLFVAGAVI